MRGKLFFQGPRPLKRDSRAGKGSGPGAEDSTWATARTCSGRVAGQGWTAGPAVVEPATAAEAASDDAAASAVAASAVDASDDRPGLVSPAL